MEHSIHEQSGFSVLQLKGEVDLSVSPQAREQILALVKGKKSTLVDLSQVTYIDSSGIACLVEGYQKARVQKTAFGLLAVSLAVRKVLELARLDQIFPIFDDIDQAKELVH